MALPFLLSLSEHLKQTVQYFYTLQCLKSFDPQFIVPPPPLPEQYLPHARQGQQAVPRSANTAQCCLSFPAGLRENVVASPSPVSPTCTVRLSDRLCGGLQARRRCKELKRPDYLSGVNK